MKVFIVKDEELNDVMGEKQLLDYAQEQYVALKDSEGTDNEIVIKYKDGINTVAEAIEVLVERGFTVKIKEVF